MQYRHILVFLLAVCFSLEAKLPEINSTQVTSKIQEIMKAHASYKSLTPELVKRILQNYIEELDPTKTYFIKPDIEKWLNPTDELLQQVLVEMNKSDFRVFKEIQGEMIKAIRRRREIDKEMPVLPTKVKPEEFKNMEWAPDEKALLIRISRIKGLQAESAAKLPADLQALSLQRIAKMQDKKEEEYLNPNPVYLQRLMLSHVLKATAAALDAHTAYFTPDEATQFMINVQQRLFGIGAQLRDDLNGFTIVKIIEGSPAGHSKLKVKDRVIAVNGEPVVGMDITEAVELIRGEEHTPVVLTVIRIETEGDKKTERKLDITIPRGEVVLKETRYDNSYEPFGDGGIAYIHLHSFYQDPESSSADDITQALTKMQADHKIKGVILDLRSDAGGLLSQAVSVAGLFITKGIVASIKDDKGNVQHLRDLDGKTIWNGPLIVLINRGSASASEIVAQSLKDYGRALIVGDDHSYGKGSYQTFTLNTTKSDNSVNPQGEYKVTRGRYYTVSGKTPQLVGVKSDIIVPGALTEMEIGEKYAKYPLENDSIKPNFDDDLSDVPFLQRDRIRQLYKFDLQQPLDMYSKYLPTLQKNSQERIKNNKNYQNFLHEIKKKDDIEDETSDHFGQNDLQLNETYNIMKDLIYLHE
jgi:carboxyl-terminal processing protease